MTTSNEQHLAGARRTAPRPVPPIRRKPTSKWVHVGLFVATYVTTTIAGAGFAGVDVFSDWTHLTAGLPFSTTLMTILLIHEMGHYTLARYHGVDATLPYFIPAPPPFPVGTFGAFIRMDEPPPNRRALFDVGAAGPWAGLIAAIPAIYVGLQWSKTTPRGLVTEGILLGEPLLFQFLSYLAIGPLPEHMEVELHAVALAGWFGLLVTFLNLLPMGQLDGGHVAYAMFGRAHRWVARGFLAVIFVLGFLGWPGWFIWVALVLFIGLDHPPTLDGWVQLDPKRMFAGWLTAGILALVFIGTPFAPVEPLPEFEGEKMPASIDIAPEQRYSTGGQGICV